MVSGQFRFEDVDRQRQRYDRAAFRTPGGASYAPVRLGNGIDKGESETMTGRILPLYESLENPAADIRRKAQTVVFNQQFC